MNKEDREIIKELTLGFAEKMQEKQDHITQLESALHDCINQIEYLHEKFKETGSGNAVVAKAKQALQK